MRYPLEGVTKNAARPQVRGGAGGTIKYWTSATKNAARPQVRGGAPFTHCTNPEVSRGKLFGQSAESQEYDGFLEKSS